MTEEHNIQCQSCGKLIKDDFNVCPYCGRPVKLICSKCGEVLLEEYNVCPKCGEKVKGKSIRFGEKSASNEFSKKITAIGEGVKPFFQLLIRAIIIIALTFFDWLKKSLQSVLNWFKSLNWEKVGGIVQVIGSGLASFIQKTFSWLKKISEKLIDWLKTFDWGKVNLLIKTLGAFLVKVFGKSIAFLRKALGRIWTFLSRTFVRIRDFLSGILEKRLSPDLSKKVAGTIIIAGGVLSLLLVVGLIFNKPGPPQSPTPPAQEAEQVSEAPQPLVDPADQKWLVMVYADADDEVLEEDMLFDVNEMEMAGSSDRVQIVTQIDRFNGGYAEDGDWTGARRYFINQDSDLSTINSSIAQELGEINMGDPLSLVEFVVWSIENYPADRYVLILSDHGGGWTGGWTDSDPNFDYLTLNEIDFALDIVVSGLPNGKFDIVGFDACLMSQLDVFSAIEPYANYSVASEEVEPAAGWAYNAFLQQLVDNPAMGPRELSSVIVETYLEQDQRFLNDEARARFLQGDTTVTAQEVLDLILPTSTLTAVDLAFIPQINQLLNDFAYYITTIDQTSVAAARNYATSFYSVFGKDTPPSFIDLINFISILEQETAEEFNSDVGTQLKTSINKAIVKNKAGNEKAGAQGLSFYFPNSTMYTNEYGGYQVYTTENDRFMKETRWDDFLAFHYAGVAFDPGSQTAVIPTRSLDVSGPGAGQIQVGPIALSANSVSPGDTLSFNTEIIGNNVGNVYMQYGWLAQDVRTMLVVLGMDIIRSELTREIEGVFYPDWGSSGKIPISYDFEPMLAFIADEFENNITFVEAVVSKYGATEDDITISTPGIFTFAGSGRQLYAEMNFTSTGVMVDLIGYSGQIEITDLESEFEGLFQISYLGEEGAGNPHQITPSVGDTFMPFFIGYIIEDDIYLNVKSDPITFQKEPLKLVAAPVTEFDEIEFPYYVAVAVEDLDGILTDAVALDTFTVNKN